MDSSSESVGSNTQNLMSALCDVTRCSEIRTCCMLGDVLSDNSALAHSRADDGRGSGTGEHFGRLEGGGQDHSVHQSARKEEDIWQRQLPVSHRYQSVIFYWIVLEMYYSSNLCLGTVFIYVLLTCLFFPLGFRDNQANTGDHSCVCECGASVSSVWGELHWNSITRCKLSGFSIATSLFSSEQRELEEAWGVQVFDRYSVVLHIFRCNAKTKEAKLQVSLAEIPLLR